MDDDDDVTRAVHPPVMEVPIMGGQHKVRVTPWTMAQRAELAPRVAALFKKILEFDKNPRGVDLEALFLVAEDEIAEIVRASIEIPEEVKWAQLWYEDLPGMARAVWKICVNREDGGGIAGKMVSVLGDGFVAVARKLFPPQMQRAESFGDSPSSPSGGEPPPSTSGER